MLDIERTRQYLKDFDFKSLFIEELGWDRHALTFTVNVDGQVFTLKAIAEKRGVQIFECSPDAEGGIPVYSLRQQIERQAAKTAYEHLIIFTDEERTKQIWQWVSKEPAKPLAYREHTYYRGQSGLPLIQRLNQIVFRLDEEEGLTIDLVAFRLKDALNKEHVTRRFYDRFKAEHDAFLRFLKGIPDEKFQRWYVSVMLNRLMFIYFVQKKGFLDGDTDYLRHKLETSQQKGSDRFYTDFLCPLFFEGFARRPEERPPEINRMLGKVPYLNGGLFLKHQIEERHGQEIRIEDTAFERLFAFFDQYRWHLDERPLRDDNEINPDVLGYIFEKYINQKQMGAYYTKEDITEYISKNTVIPFLFDRAQEKCRIAFEGEASVWSLLRQNPDRYLYEAVRKGVGLPLPEEIAAGLEDVAKRTGWNRPAPEEYALPTEIWREVVARRQRYEAVRGKLERGEVRSINDLITYNLDIRQFAQDVIESCRGPELLRAFYEAIQQVTVLDPTCGSGAFLFAALSILEPLYEACLDRMQAFLTELEILKGRQLDPRRAEQAAEKSGADEYLLNLLNPQRFQDFEKILDRINAHPIRRYFILKSIIVNNLYGVDIMEEAVEICKLRLFLKLVAQVDEADRIEPLPDIDFNIRAGNTLVGYATYEEVQKAVLGDRQLKMDIEDDMERFDKQAQEADMAFRKFRRLQTDSGSTPQTLAEAKEELRARLAVLEDELNRYLAGEYGHKTRAGWESPGYQNWLESHQPFHWFIEFYGIIRSGGFDVIIGNPPYVEYTKVRQDYTIRGYDTESCGNLYAFVIERCLRLLCENGRKGMIVPHSAICTDRMEPLLAIFSTGILRSWFSTYGIRPAKLFVGVEQRLAVYIIQKASSTVSERYSSRYHRWHEECRSHLFFLIQYANISDMSFPNSFPKVHHPIERSLWAKMISCSRLRKHLVSYPTDDVVYFHNAPRYWIRALVLKKWRRL